MSPWPQDVIAKYPRLTDDSDNAVSIRALARKAYQIHMPEKEWNEVNPMVRE